LFPYTTLFRSRRRLVGDLRDDRKFLRVQSFDVRLVRTRLDVDGLRANVERELDGTGGKRVDEVDEELGGNGDRALILDLRGDPAIDADFQIRRCEAKSSGIRTQENVSEDRKTSACRHTAAGERESVREV